MIKNIDRITVNEEKLSISLLIKKIYLTIAVKLNKSWIQDSLKSEKINLFKLSFSKNIFLFLYVFNFLKIKSTKCSDFGVIYQIYFSNK